VDARPLYQSLRPWLIETFGRPVHRVALDAGSQCPNRDGTKGFGGCVYCDVEGSGTGALRRGVDLAAQLEQGLARVARRDAGGGAIAYFQSYSNTYVEPARLSEVLAVVEPYLERPAAAGVPRIVAVAVATRPDTLSKEALDVLQATARRAPVWVELGLESASDAVLRDTNRLHTLADFEDAVARAHARGLSTVAHAILGLPGDGRDGARATAHALARARCAGVKVHQLMVLRRTALERWWRDGRLELLSRETYVAWLADFVERLAPEQVLHRLSGESPGATLLAPQWSRDKHGVRRALEAELERRGTRQGRFLGQREALQSRM
jgi:radical SAM protein (TIGR01212 family)